jgi:hypothetical protein
MEQLMTKDEALKLALDALETSMYPQQKQLQAITAIKAALEAKDEPVAWVNIDDLYDLEAGEDGDVPYVVRGNEQPKNMPKSIPLYTTPPQRKPLTDEPVAWFCKERNLVEIDCPAEDDFRFTLGWEPLYSTPPQRKPLSEEEIGAILEDVNAYGTRLYTFARAIEAAHGIKEKNT